MTKTHSLGATLSVAAISVAAIFLAPPYHATAQSTGPSRRETITDPEVRDLNALLAKAQSALDNKDYAAAARAYKSYLEKRPKDALIHYQLGYAYTALGQTADARDEYRKATELDPKMGAAFLNLGLTELADDPGASVDAFQKAVELTPDDVRPKVLLATALAHSGRATDAIPQFEAAEKIDGGNFELHLGFGEALMAVNRTPDAEREFRAAIALDGNDPSAHLGLGQALIAEKKFQDGAMQLGAYLQAQPADDKTRLLRISALIQTAQFNDALADLDHLTAANQQSLPALESRYQALEGAKRHDEAIAALLKAEALAPNDPEIHTRIGLAALQSKAYPRAAQEFSTALKLRPNDPGALGGLAEAQYLGKNYDNALKTLQLVEQTGPLSPQSLFVRADCYDRLGRKVDALSAYESFLSANTDRTSDFYFAAAQRVRELRRELGKAQ